MAPCVDSFGPESRMNEGFRAEMPAGGARVWQVGALVRAIADILQARFNPAAVRGEISGFSRAASGHCYFSLKDTNGQIRCAMFRRAAQLVDFDPAEGDLVEVQGRLDVYGPRGALQLIAHEAARARESIQLLVPPDAAEAGVLVEGAQVITGVIAPASGRRTSGPRMSF